jgi:SAM-dependent methyltransferase
MKQVVYSAYSKYAEKIKKQGYRHNPVYLASKALSDWYLMSLAGLAGKTILNVGCAEPIDELHFAELCKYWISLDVNSDVLRAAHEVYHRLVSDDRARKVTFCCADATSLPFPEESFDLVVSFSAIEHIPAAADRLQVFREVARVLTPSGYFAVTVPNRWNIPWNRWLKQALREGTTDFGYGYNYSPRELKRHLEQTGFRAIEFSSDFRLPYRLLPISRADDAVRTALLYFGERMGYLAQRHVTE